MAPRKIKPKNLLRTPVVLHEAELCSRFIEYVRDLGGWAVYPETAGFDILLVRRSDSLMVGIEAKQVLNTKALSQILPSLSVRMGKSGGVDHRAILVPWGRASQELLEIAGALGVTVIQFAGEQTGVRTASLLTPLLPVPGRDTRSTDIAQHWHDWAPVERIVLPDYVPDSRAGSPAPIRLTPWKIKAIKMAVLLEERHVTPSDFKALGLSIANWLRPASPWLVRVERGLFTAGPDLPNFRTQHPRNYEEIRADRSSWIRALSVEKTALVRERTPRARKKTTPAASKKVVKW